MDLLKACLVKEESIKYYLYDCLAQQKLILKYFEERTLIHFNKISTINLGFLLISLTDSNG